MGVSVLREGTTRHRTTHYTHAMRLNLSSPHRNAIIIQSDQACTSLERLLTSYYSLLAIFIANEDCKKQAKPHKSLLSYLLLSMSSVS